MDRNRRGFRSDFWGVLTGKGWVDEEELAKDRGVVRRWAVYWASFE